MDHYKVLEIPQTASQAEIRAAYKRLAKLYHPDVNSSPTAHSLFQHISESYHILSDPARRASYDASRSGPYYYRENQQETSSYGRQATHRRNPHSYRAAPPLRQEDILRPYMKYAYTFSWIGLVLSLLLAVDFFSPGRIHEERIAQNYYLPGAAAGQTYGRPQLIFTDEGTRMEVRAGESTLILSEGMALVEKSVLFGFPQKVTGQDGVSLSPLVLVYGHLSFFPILLFVFSALGAFLLVDIVFDFNVCLVSSVLSVITLVVIVATS